MFGQQLHHLDPTHVCSRGAQSKSGKVVVKIETATRLEIVIPISLWLCLATKRIKREIIHHRLENEHASQTNWHLRLPTRSKAVQHRWPKDQPVLRGFPCQWLRLSRHQMHSFKVASCSLVIRVFHSHSLCTQAHGIAQQIEANGQMTTVMETNKHMPPCLSKNRARTLPNTWRSQHSSSILRSISLRSSHQTTFGQSPMVPLRSN